MKKNEPNEEENDSNAYYDSLKDLGNENYFKSGDPHHFIKSVKNKIKIGSVYKVVKTYAVDETMPYCPILVEIADANLLN